MILRATIGTTRLIFSLAKIAKIIGVNSKIECENCDNWINGNNGGQCNISKDSCHILMWDFDKKTLDYVSRNLEIVQNRFMLSDIHILETNHDEGNFIAYCFTRTDWQKAIEIVSSTRGVDWQFVRISVFRGWFTLRTGAKKSGVPHIVKRLQGISKPDCTPENMQSWVEYETLDKD